MEITNLINMTGNAVTIMRTGFTIEPDWDTENKDIARPVQYFQELDRYGVSTVVSGYKSKSLRKVNYETTFLYESKEVAEQAVVEEGIRKAYLVKGPGWDGEKKIEGNVVMYL